jgi:hypothetical protein
MIERRKIIFGTYDTAEEGLWTLTGWALSDAEQKTEYLDLPGANGRLDVSTALTDGEPVYNDRTLTATFECSEGTRLEREDRISRMVNWLDGWRMNITLPDDPLHYITGRVHVARLYNDPAHASVQVTATCDPWRYNVTETAVGLQATAAEQTTALINSGRRSMVPTLTIAGGDVLLAAGAASWALSAGVYALPDLYLRPGSTPIRYSGTGTLLVTYREAVL